MNATFQVVQIAHHFNGETVVTLNQTYNHNTRGLSDSSSPKGEISLTVSDKTGFFQQGHKYVVGFSDAEPKLPAKAPVSASGVTVKPATAQVALGKTAQFSVDLAKPDPKGVTWSVVD